MMPDKRLTDPARAAATELAAQRPRLARGKPIGFIGRRRDENVTSWLLLGGLLRFG